MRPAFLNAEAFLNAAASEDTLPLCCANYRRFLNKE